MKTYHIITNPVAGKNKGLKALETVRRVFETAKVNFSTHTSAGEKDATNIVKRLTEAGETEIIALGGDGTLHEVLNGISNPSACNLGLIPCGTGNDFAEHAGIPMDTEEAATLILHGEAKATDFIEVGGVRCMNVAGIGMDVDVLERCKRGKMNGKLKYLFSLVQSLFAFKGYEVEVLSEGVQETHNALLASVCNGSQFGGGIRICPVADSADEKLDVVVVDCIGGKWKIIKAFLQLMKGKILQLPETLHFLCDEVKFRCLTPCTLQLDGELYKDLDFDVRVKSGLKFYY